MPIKVKVGEIIIGKQETEAVLNVLKRGKITEGIEVANFERLWANYIGTKFAVLVNSGTSALIAGLLALKHKYRLPDKTKVLVSPITYVATVNAVKLAGFEPVFCDINPRTFTLEVNSARAAIQKNKGIKIILPVHLMGYVNDIDGLRELCRKYNLILGEDSAQAHGSTYEGKRAGSFGEVSFFSFYVAHNIQAGELGAVNTNDPEIYRLVKKLKANGRMCDCPICLRDKGLCPKLPFLRKKFPSEDYDPRFLHELIGYNFKTMDLIAALASVQAKKIEKIITQRQKNVKRLNQGLKKFSTILQLPLLSQEVSYLAYPLVIKRPDIISRQKIREELEKNGIETRPLFGCIPTQQPAYNYLRPQYLKKLPNADHIGRNGFYIGCHQFLKSQDIAYIIKTFHEILKPLKSL